ncbi:hypothetical protein C8Q73DRAFT_690462 [Cubamyces lactineus]|nr:hypothetical protein C8Q73DRAFT_690462 [Cubamyces lactineus]
MRTQSSPNDNEMSENVGGSVSSPSKRKILIISLEKESYTDEMYAQLYRSLRKNANVTEVTHTRSAKRALSSAPRPYAVLVSDAAITDSRHSALLTQLIKYARSGGRVVIGMQFSNHFPLGEVATFFHKWGLEWDHGSYHRTTFQLNPAGVPAALSADALFPTLSMKALHIKNAPCECAVYLPTPTARVESLVFAPAPISGDRVNESPAVFTRIGQGYLGYVGDVNAEQGSLRLTIEMCGVRIQPGDMGPAKVTTGMRISPGGLFEEMTRVDQEIPLLSSRIPAASVSAPSTTAASVSSSKAASLAHTCAAPASSSTAARSPPRPREAEVVARAAQRAKRQAERLALAEGPKEEGNALFRQGKWAEAAELYQEAAVIAGPQPVYLSNLAAAALKLERWDVAESAATRALFDHPSHVKARFRRAIARKEMRRFTAAETDLQYILERDPSNTAAHTEVNALRAAKRDTPRSQWVEEDEEEVEYPFDFGDESDSEDFYHTGNGIPCKYYNHDGCARGPRCHYSHAPDRKSVRDELGRNVCIYWLLGECRFGKERCVYAHDRTYLPPNGWWTDEARNAGLRNATNALFEFCSRRHAPKALLAEAAKPDWREELWAMVDFTEEPTPGEHEAEEWSDEDGGTEDFYEEMLMQGIKPWEITSPVSRFWLLLGCFLYANVGLDLQGEMAAIHRALYEGY